MNTQITPRALRELRRDIAAIPPQGDFIAGRRLRSLLRSVSWAHFAYQAGQAGVVFHRTLGPVDLNLTETKELIIKVRATGDRLSMKLKGRKWE